MSCDDEFAEYALNRNRHLFPTPEGWNDALWREHFITNRIRRLIYGGFWPPPIGWCTDLLSDGAYELPKEDLIELLNPPRPRLVCREWGAGVMADEPKYSPQYNAEWIDQYETYMRDRRRRVKHRSQPRRKPKRSRSPSLRLQLR